MASDIQPPNREGFPLAKQVKHGDLREVGCGGGVNGGGGGMMGLVEGGGWGLWLTVHTDSRPPSSS